MTWLRKTPVKIGILFILPVLMLTVWSFFIYPLKPHCSLGKSLFGCTPMCEPISYFGDGRPSGYKAIPCFHNKPSDFQEITYKYALIYYFLISLASLVVAFKVGFKRFLRRILRIIFAPLVLMWESQKKRVVSRIFIIIASFFLVIEWGFGYLVVIQTLTGLKLLNI